MLGICNFDKFSHHNQHCHYHHHHHHHHYLFWAHPKFQNKFGKQSSNTVLYNYIIKSVDCFDQTFTTLFAQLLVGQSHTLNHQNGVKFHFRSICKHHKLLLSKKITLLFCLFGAFFLLIKRRRKILDFCIMAHCAPPPPQHSFNLKPCLFKSKEGLLKTGLLHLHRCLGKDSIKILVVFTTNG